MENSIEFFLNTHLEWSLSRQDLVITEGTKEKEEEIRSIEGKFKWVQGETQMQWTWIEEEKEIGHAMYAGSGAIWPKIVGKDTREGVITKS